jgi:hypothetical protein
MKNNIRLIASLVLLTGMGILQGCKEKDPSIIKIFVRSNANALVSDARVVIIGDINSNPPTREYVDTLLTNASGFAEFNMEDYYGAKPKKGETGYFDIVVKKDTRVAEGRIRARANITNVETIKLPQ